MRARDISVRGTTLEKQGTCMLFLSFMHLSPWIWIGSEKLASMLHARVLLLHHGLSHFAMAMKSNRSYRCKQYISVVVGDDPYVLLIHTYVYPVSRRHSRSKGMFVITGEHWYIVYYSWSCSPSYVLILSMKTHCTVHASSCQIANSISYLQPWWPASGRFMFVYIYAAKNSCHLSPRVALIFLPE
jgi:hypothetical protein